MKLESVQIPDDERDKTFSASEIRGGELVTAHVPLAFYHGNVYLCTDFERSKRFVNLTNGGTSYLVDTAAKFKRLPTGTKVTLVQEKQL